MLSAIIDLLYPKVCASCGESISKAEEIVCHSCYSKMAFCPYRPGQIHPIEKIFWGRSVVQAATALFVFSKHGTGQHLLHRLKYKGDQEVGMYMGKLLAKRILDHPEISNVDCLVPVPLFEKKKQIRGYNQSEVIGRGLAEVLGIPVITNYLRKVENTSTQTRKGRLERVENVRTAFQLADGDHSQYNHVLLIDDVITTGSTLEACINILSPAHKVSVATLAYQ